MLVDVLTPTLHPYGSKFKEFSPTFIWVELIFRNSKIFCVIRFLFKYFLHNEHLFVRRWVQYVRDYFFKLQWEKVNILNEIFMWRCSDDMVISYYKSGEKTEFVLHHDFDLKYASSLTTNCTTIDRSWFW